MTPPRFPDRILTWLVAPHLREEVLGDRHERFFRQVEQVGEAKARRRYWRDMLAYVRPTFIRRKPSGPAYRDYPQPTTTDMLQNYFKIAFRNLAKNRVYSFINIFGLASGMAVAMLIGLWIYGELSFNTGHKNYDRIAKVMQNQTFNGKVETWGSQAMQLAPELRTSYGSYFKHVVTAGFPGDYRLAVGDRKITQTGNYMEPGITDMLALTMRKGTRSGLQDPNSILLSASAAEALFGTTDPLHKTVRISNKYNVKVTGVYEDIPDNSSFGNLAFIAPFDLQKRDLPEWVSWGNSWFQTFVQIADKTDMNAVSGKIKLAKWNRVKGDDDRRFKPELFLLPMPRWHLYSDFKNGVNVGGQIQIVWLFGIIGLFVLLLACINFMNLSTARSEKRAKEVGIRKAIGSVRQQLIAQFFSESLLVVFLAFVIALVLAQLSLPLFNEVTGKEISLLGANSPAARPWFWLASLGFCLFTSLVAGSYPAFYLSAFQPVKVLKGTFRVGRFAAIPRQTLVVVQFTVSVTLIIGTIVVFRQIQFAKNRPIGYSRANLVTVPIRNDALITHFPTVRDELRNTGLVEEVAATDVPITATGVTNSGFHWKGKAPDMADEFVTMRVTHEFGKMIDWQLKEGRDFSKAFTTDSTGFILNEAAVAYMGLRNPVGETIKWGDDSYKVIGVVKDLITQSPYNPVKQTIFVLNYKRVSLLTLKINPAANAHDALDKIESVYKKYDADNPFTYRFVDQEYAKKFGDEERVGKLAFFFAILAIFISCLGLFGLASFVAEQRTKEIGVRKVLGASVLNLWGLLSKEFVVLVVIAFGIATPIAWYFLTNWLQKYDYRTDISWWIFAASGAGALLITLLTVSFQSIKAALMNPVTSLRSE
ncbi:ABC transporter permease [Larkinella sp. VNQ87]|uniref:ABC transporter permease n=1 Tax=Larkinella sp. VNQ87 TaxID=3400921 RepID=UPI003C0BDEB3